MKSSGWIVCVKEGAVNPTTTAVQLRKGRGREWMVFRKLLYVLIWDKL